MIGEKLNEAYTWQAVYDLNPLSEFGIRNSELRNGFNNVDNVGNSVCTGEILADLWEMDAQGVQRATYADIDRERVKIFHVYKTVEAIAFLSPRNTTNLFRPFISLALHTGARLIWRKRRRQRVFSEDGVFLTLYMVGWQETIDGHNFQAINYIYHFTSQGLNTENDIVVLSGGGKSDVELFDFEIFPLPIGREPCQSTVN